jgi:hypothetical protein
VIPAAPAALPLDAESILRGSRRPLVIGMGGGGDVVGALATAEAMRRYDGAEPLVGGLTWERRPIDPVPGARAMDEIEHAWPVADGVLLAGPRTGARGGEVVFAESRMAEVLGRPTVLVDPGPGATAVAAGLAEAVARLRRDLVVLIDVGGDVLAQGDEPGLRSPLCDALMLAAGGRLLELGVPCMLGIFGIGCDSELTTGEVLERLGAVAEAGGLCGARGLTGPVTERLEAALARVSTEASAQALRAFRGVRGEVSIRGGTRRFELTTLAAQTTFLDVRATLASVGRLAQAVAQAPGLEAANDALHALGVRSELDLEREAAAQPG